MKHISSQQMPSLNGRLWEWFMNEHIHEFMIEWVDGIIRRM
jgi:hypothetical protein